MSVETYALHVPASAHTAFAVVGDSFSLKEVAAEFRGAPSLVGAPADSKLRLAGTAPIDIADPTDDRKEGIANDGDKTFSPDAVGLYTLRFGTPGVPGWREVKMYAGPRTVDTHPAFGGKGRKVMRALFGSEPLYKLDLTAVTDKTPWPLLTNPTTGEKSSPDFRQYGG